MPLDVLTLEHDRAAWDEALATFPSRTRDVYFGSAYQLLWQRNGDGRAMGAVFEHGDSTVLYPFLLRDLAGLPGLGAGWNDYHDIQTPYGYGGPLVRRESGDEHVLRLFRQAFTQWCRDNGVVSEFVRFHPLLDTHLGFEPYLEVTRHNTTVWCRTDCSIDERLRGLGSSTRRGVRKAKSSGLEVYAEFDDESYERFAELYRQTMQRRNATGYYLFADRYFSDFRELLGPYQSLLTVRKDDEIVAAGLFMTSPAFLHYHLGASDERFLPLRPNNLLFYEALRWGCSRGQVAMHLGGGYGPDDDLFRFKAGFSPLRASFYIGRHVHDEAAYDKAWAARGGAGKKPPDGGFFPAYRAPLPGDGA